MSHARKALPVRAQPVHIAYLLLHLCFLTACFAESPRPNPTSPPPAATVSSTPSANPVSVSSLLTPTAIITPAINASPSGIVAAQGFQAIGHLGLERGRANGGLAIARHCAYVGSRSDNRIVVVDITDPAHPQRAPDLAIPGASIAIELRTSVERSLLIIASGNADALHIYDIHDCLKPIHLSSLHLPSAPHEFYLWRDPAKPARLLAYVAMFTSSNGLHVVDMSDASRPVALLTWGVPALSGLLHSISLSPDGRRAYISYWSGGMLTADTTDLASGVLHPQIRLLGKLAYAPMSTHSAVAVPGRPILAITDEIYSCPFGWLHLVDVRDLAGPIIVGEFRLPQNRSTPCAGGTWTAHNPVALQNLLLLTWYDGGLVAVDIADAAHPRLAGQFRVDGERFWSYPIVANGLVHVVSIEGGLYLLAYQGPHQSEIHSTPLLQGNAN